MVLYCDLVPTIAYVEVIIPWEVIIVIFYLFPPSDNTDPCMIWTSHYSDNIPPECACNYMFSIDSDLRNMCVKSNNCIKTQEPNTKWKKFWSPQLVLDAHISMDKSPAGISACVRVVQRD
jgi:hypothetical protein